MFIRQIRHLLASELESGIEWVHPCEANVCNGWDLATQNLIRLWLFKDALGETVAKCTKEIVGKDWFSEFGEQRDEGREQVNESLMIVSYWLERYILVLVDWSGLIHNFKAFMTFISA